MFKATTIAACKIGKKAAIAGDGQVTFGDNTIMKHTAKKIRRIYKDKVLIGFAGAVADAFTLSEKFEEKLEQHSGDLRRAAVELAQEWRSDKAIRKLEALMIAVDADDLLIISGSGEVIDPDDGIASIGSGGMYALAAAKALKENTSLEPRDIVEKALKIASSICVFTNDNIIVEEL
ncbi:MAG: ATP-dependent protease subunit HslV [Clostridiales bacterium]|nr:ATP-dependent protease subunit HslV [Clostridiales bacterium]HBM80939.1 HslU--HslV peptidase proteolytic subunit [Clostridiaceae bacterium]